MGKKKEMFSEHGKKPPYQITDCLAVGPQSAYGGPKLSDLKKLGFKHIIDLNADTNEEHEARRVGLEYHSMGISDESSKRVWLSKLSSAVETVRRASDRGELVYPLLTHGVGRSPTFAIAYLMSKGHSIEEAIKLAKDQRPQTWNPGNPVSMYRDVLESYATYSQYHKLKQE